MKNYRISHRAHAGFTLIELLVVISIIAILASLAVPGVNLALNKAKQMKDVANAKQVGTILFTAANDNNGSYPSTNGTGAAATDAIGVFEGLVVDGYLNNASVLATNKCIVYKGAMDAAVSLDDSGTTKYVGWDYVKGLSTSDNGSLPLIVTNGAFASLAAMQSAGTVTIDATKNLWGEEGVAILFLGQNAEFVKARKVGGNSQIGKSGEPVVSNTIAIPAGVTLFTAR
jgi:prepilin-type N-terminal cleavage/methylation domain-containing protein